MKRKYPMSLFFTGMVLDLMKRWHLPLLALVLLLVPNTLAVVPVIPLILWVAISAITQVISAITISKMLPGDESFDRMFMDNGRGHENIVNETIEIMKNKSDSE